MQKTYKGTYKGWVLEKISKLNVYEAHKGGVRIKCNDYEELFNSIKRIEGEPCKWLSEAEVCVNAKCDCCADFPGEEYCMSCRFYESEDSDD